MVRDRGVCYHYNILKDKVEWVVRYAALSVMATLYDDVSVVSFCFVCRVSDHIVELMDSTEALWVAE